MHKHSPRFTVRRGRTATKAAIFALVLALPTVVSSTVASAAPAAVNCNGVFTGLTPSGPIVKTADKATALPGETITYTVTWTPNGTANVNFVDCFRVGDGSDDSLNDLVAGGNVDYSGVNDGTETFSVAIPNDPSLVGSTVVDRVKCGMGCRESKSGLVAVTVVAPPEVCGDSIDNDLDGETDEGCSIVDDTSGDDDDSTGDDTSGDDASGDDTSGDDDDATGDDTAGDDTAGDDDDASGDDTAGDDDVIVEIPGDDDDASGDDASGDDDDTAGDDDASGDDTAGDDDDVPAGDDDTAGGAPADDDSGDNDDSDTGSEADVDDESGPSRVLGRINRQPALATTGVGLDAAWYGVFFLAAGLVLRFGKFRRIRETSPVRRSAALAYPLTAVSFRGLSPPFRWRAHGARAPDRRRRRRT